jgi:hypothetical protein
LADVRALGHSDARLIESLEARIAPAIVFAFTDMDGDHVTVRISKGRPGDATFVLQDAGAGQQLQTIELNGSPVFDGAKIVVRAKDAGDGNGLANVGFIDASGVDIFSVSVDGDLGRIYAGDNISRTPALRALVVDSLGEAGISTQEDGGSNNSIIIGALGFLSVKNDIVGAHLSVSGGTLGLDGKIGTARIGGSIRGFDSFDDALLSSTGDMTRVVVAGNVTSNAAINSGNTLAGFGSDTVLGFVNIGGSLGGSIYSLGTKTLSVKIGKDINAGFVSSNGQLNRIVVDGSVIGGDAFSSGEIFSFSSIGSAFIGGDVRGGAGEFSGLINAFSIKNLSIRGSLTGGAGNHSGAVLVGDDLLVARIGGDLRGGSISDTNSLDQSGIIHADHIGALLVGGSIISGGNTGSGSLTGSGVVWADHDIGTIVVTGNLTGNETAAVTISASGTSMSTGKTDLAIGSISVGGSVTRAGIFAGYDTSLNGTNADAQIGAIRVAKDFVDSSIVAGTAPGLDGLFGTSDDLKITGGIDQPDIISKIASVVIGGHVHGTDQAVNASDHFGIVAEQIDVLIVGKTRYGLDDGPGNDTFYIADTPDLAAREITS